MKEESEPYFEENEIEELIVRYEGMLKTNIIQYFDVFEFENIVEYYIENLQFKKAFDAIEMAFKLHPNSINLLLKKSQLLLENDCHVEALKILEGIQKIENNNYEFHLTKAHAYYCQNKIDLAKYEFNHAINIAIEDKEEVYLNIAFILIKVEDYCLAVEYLEKANNLFPGNFDILYELANCYERMDNFDLSIEYYNTILDLNPFAESAWFSIGLLYEKINDYNKAIEAYDFVTAINENYSIAYLNKGNVNLNSGNFIEAIKSYKEYLYFNDDCPEVYCYIGECFERLSEYRKSKEYYQKALGIDKSISDAWFGLGIVEMYLDNHFESIEYIKKAIQIENDNSDYWFSLGKVNLKLGFYNESKDAFIKAIELDVYDFESWLLFAEVYWKEENFSKAIAILMEGHKYNNAIADYNYKLAAYLLATNQKSHAIQYFKNAFNEDRGGYKIIYNYVNENQIPKEIKYIINKLY